MLNLIKDNWNNILTLILTIFILFESFIKLTDNYFQGHPAIATIIGSIINAIIVLLAMLFVDFQNKERWKKDIYTKEEARLWIELRSLLIEYKDYHTHDLSTILKFLTEDTKVQISDPLSLFKEYKDNMHKIIVVNKKLKPFYPHNQDFNQDFYKNSLRFWKKMEEICEKQLGENTTLPSENLGADGELKALNILNMEKCVNSIIDELNNEFKSKLS